ncbi:unnamed protein product [Periconia digitata]|uniref:Uncharacterized protein n=1 Tax=Periconia digitata TaxID=1303443 RepID=A0A9W4UHM2_9PLEO|nr:unnamed protein product [Periconia digitata]
MPSFTRLQRQTTPPPSSLLYLMRPIVALLEHGNGGCPVTSFIHPTLFSSTNRSRLIHTQGHIVFPSLLQCNPRLVPLTQTPCLLTGHSLVTIGLPRQGSTQSAAPELLFLIPLLYFFLFFLFFPVCPFPSCAFCLIPAVWLIWLRAYWCFAPSLPPTKVWPIADLVVVTYLSTFNKKKSRYAYSRSKRALDTNMAIVYLLVSTQRASSRYTTPS